MLTVEFRITMPMTVEEYQIAQLFCVAQFSKENTNHSEGIEVVTNEPFEDKPLLGDEFASGQYTYKIYHLGSKFPSFIRYLLSKKIMSIHEEAWNAYPYCRTILSHPTYDSFRVTIETMHLGDRGDTPNVHQLPPELLKLRKVVHIDITEDSGEVYCSSQDPKTYKSLKTGRGPLENNWRKSVKPVMTCYKLVTVNCPIMFQARLESWIQDHEQKLFLEFHRKMFCQTDEWYGKTLQEIRVIEEKLKEELNQMINNRRES